MSVEITDEQIETLNKRCFTKGLRIYIDNPAPDDVQNIHLSLDSGASIPQALHDLADSMEKLERDELKKMEEVL